MLNRNLTCGTLPFGARALIAPEASTRLIAPPARYVTTALVDVTERLALVAPRSMNSDAVAGAADAHAATMTARLAAETCMGLKACTPRGSGQTPVRALASPPVMW